MPPLDQIQRHLATIDGWPVIWYYSDGQRLGSINQDYWETCEDIILIVTRDSMNVYMMFSWINLSIYEGIKKISGNFFKQDRNCRLINTLPAHLINKLGHWSVKNELSYTQTYGVEEVTYARESGRTGDDKGDLSKGTYYFIWKRTRSGIFITDAYQSIFDNQRLRAKFGFRDAPQYENVRASIDEFKSQGSYWIQRLLWYAKMNEQKAKITFTKETRNGKE